jgi:hypothetical protein
MGKQHDTMKTWAASKTVRLHRTYDEEAARCDESLGCTLNSKVAQDV